MGKSLVVAAPFIGVFLALIGWGLLEYGKSIGRKQAPKRSMKAADDLLAQANDIFADLLYVDDVSADDIITPQTRKTLNTWRNDYRREKRL